MTLDEYVAWAAGAGRPAGPEDCALVETGLGLAAAVGQVAGVLARWPGGEARRREHLADGLADVAYHWARLCAVTGIAPAALLARSRAHVEWRRAGRPAGGPAPGAGAMTLEGFAAWAVATGAAGLADEGDGRSLGDTGLALVGDAGEVVECLRRLVREGDPHRERLAGELGDVWRYWARLAAAGGLVPGELLARSQARVESRRPAEALPERGR
jgi:hypothetical protein